MVPPMLYEAITELIKNTPTPKIAAKPILTAGSVTKELSLTAVLIP